MNWVNLFLSPLFVHAHTNLLAKLLCNLGQLNMSVMQVFHCMNTWPVTWSNEDNYLKYTLIIQSLGMGKPCTINKLSKTHLVYLWCYISDQKVNFFISPLVQALILKPLFPAMDENVPDWFIQSKMKLEVFMHAGMLLCSLFVALLDC